MTESSGKAERQNGAKNVCPTTDGSGESWRRATRSDNQACYGCGDTTKRLEVEHDHSKAKNDPREAWNGWACHPCNLRKRRKLGSPSAQGLEEGVAQIYPADVLQMKRLHGVVTSIDEMARR